MQTKSIVVSREGCPTCPVDGTGNSDCVAVYEDGSKFCYKGNHIVGTVFLLGTSAGLAHMETNYNNEFLQGECQALNNRGIRKDTCEKYHYFVSENSGRPCQVANCFKNGTIVFQHIRYYPKDFSSKGDINQATLIGAHVWGKGKRIVITEGEIDMLSVSQAFDNSWPVTSLPNGAGGALKAIKLSLEYLSNFEEIVLWFDMDEPGQKAVVECANMLPVGKVYTINSEPYHDANDMLMKGKVEDIKKAVWNAAPYRPDGIMDGTDIWNAMVTRDLMSKTIYPFPILNERTRGIKNNEIIVVVSGTSMGKSSFTRQLCYSLIKEKRKIGYFGLEETAKDTGTLLLGLELKERIHITHDNDLEDYIETKKDIYYNIFNPYLVSYKFMGADDSLIDQIRWMVKGMDCQYIVIDHINLAVANGEMGQKWEIIERFMSDLRKLVSECNFTAIVVSQLTSPDGKTSFEDGAAIQLNHIRACKGLAHAANTVISITGNSKELERQFHVLKTRTSGRVGAADKVIYNEKTGLLELDNKLINEDLE